MRGPIPDPRQEAILTPMLLTVLAASLAIAPVKKVLILGVDGLMPTALKAARTPHFDKLIADRCISYAAQAGDITVSGPGWSSMLTGVWREKHGVPDNAFKTGQGRGHGPNTPVCRTIYYLASGPSAARGTLEPAPGISDVAVTALTHLGVPLQGAWGLEGRARGLRS